MIFEKRTKNRISEIFSKYWIVLLIVVLLTATIIATVQIYRDEVVDPDSLIEYEYQDTLYIGTEKIDTLNPAISQS